MNINDILNRMQNKANNNLKEKLVVKKHLGRINRQLDSYFEDIFNFLINEVEDIMTNCKSINFSETPCEISDENKSLLFNSLRDKVINKQLELKQVVTDLFKDVKEEEEKKEETKLNKPETEPKAEMEIEVNKETEIDLKPFVKTFNNTQFNY